MSQITRVPVDEGGNEVGFPNQFPNLAPVAVPVQKVQTKYTTAMSVQQKRDLRTVEASALMEANLLGADGFYAWGAGGDRIEGATFKLAMTLVRIYGNCAVDMGEVQETRDAWIFTATFVDLETGFTLARQFRQSKTWKVYGKHDEDRKMDIRFQIGQSKAVRNVIMNAVPAWLSARALDRCMGGVRDLIEQAVKQHGLPKVQAEAMTRLAAVNVDEARLLGSMGRKTVAALTIEDLVIISGGIAALKSGADTVDSVFPVKVETPAPKPGAEGLVARLNGKAETDASPADHKPAAVDSAASPSQTPPATTGGGESAVKADAAAAGPAGKPGAKLGATPAKMLMAKLAAVANPENGLTITLVRQHLHEKFADGVESETDRKSVVAIIDGELRHWPEEYGAAMRCFLDENAGGAA